MRPPNAMVSFEEARQVDNEDLADLAPSQLEYEMARAGRIAAHDPGAFVWRGSKHITAREWADERIVACTALLTPRGSKGKVAAWVL